MPGRPILTDATNQIDRVLALEPLGEDELFERIATGMTVKDLGRWMGVPTRVIYFWRNRSKDRLRLWDEAMKFRADFFAEDGLRIVDNAPVTNEGVRKAEARGKYRQWMAACGNPEKYGKKSEAAIVSIGSLHLTVMQESDDEPPALPAREPLETEIVVEPELAAPVLADPTPGPTPQPFDRFFKRYAAKPKKLKPPPPPEPPASVRIATGLPSLDALL